MKEFDIELKNAEIKGGKCSLELGKPFKNFVTIDNIDYIPYYLDNKYPGNRGGNSFVLKLINAQEFDKDEGYPKIPSLIIKISKFYIDFFKEEHIRSKRFKEEIDALKACHDKPVSNIVKPQHFGKCTILCKGYESEFRYYTLNYAEYDLKSYLERTSPNLITRIELCLEICNTIKELWEREYYHRDIKPDNFLFIDDIWHISDLGLAEHRNSIKSLDKTGEWIGPRGWMSPESSNKYFSEKYKWGKLFDCEIDHQSDIFQLGKVIWYILQGNLPTGAIRRIDFLWKNDTLYQIIRTMLNANKSKRTKTIQEVIFALEVVYNNLNKNQEKHLTLY